MPKAVIEFSLPEEQIEHQLAIDAGKWQSVLSELDQWLRDLWKYENKQSVRLDIVRGKIVDLMTDYGISFD